MTFATVAVEVEEARQRREGRWRRGKWKLPEGWRSFGREGRKLLEAATAVAAAAADAIEVERLRSKFVVLWDEEIVMGQRDRTVRF